VKHYKREATLRTYRHHSLQKLPNTKIFYRDNINTCTVGLYNYIHNRNHAKCFKMPQTVVTLLWKKWHFGNKGSAAEYNHCEASQNVKEKH